MKFILLFLLTAIGPAYFTAQSVADDELAVRFVIERETQAYLDRNAGQQVDCWAMYTDSDRQFIVGDDSRLVAANGDRASLRRGLETCF